MNTPYIPLERTATERFDSFQRQSRSATITGENGFSAVTDIHQQWKGNVEFKVDYFIHIANILLLAAYCVRDILWLRLFAVASSIIALPYLMFQPTPLWAAFGWSVLFAGINIFHAWRLFRERRPVQLTSEEEEVRRLAFGDLPPREVLRVLSMGSWTTTAAGERLMEHGKSIESVSLVIHGKVRVTNEGRTLGELGAGEIVGSALLIRGVVSDVDAVTVEPARIIQWDTATLERYLNAHLETRSVLQRHLARDLAGKLLRMGIEVSKVPSSAAS
jgi:CRP-like cAMP-binding protein